jgi:hypothetical protein
MTSDLEIVRVGPGFIVMRDARRLMPVPCVPAEVAAMA